MSETNNQMQENVRMLGVLLGETIKEAQDIKTYDLIETVRRLSKTAHSGNDEAHQKLMVSLQNLKDKEFLPVARAFNQFLNLINTAEQYDSVSLKSAGKVNVINFPKTYNKLKDEGLTDDDIKKVIDEISIDLVLTAHPTEINRRSLINNLNQVDTCLEALDMRLPDYKDKQVMRRLKQLVAQYWHTDEIRQRRPTPNDEAKWGYEVIENSLWHAVPSFLRELDVQIYETMNYRLPLDARPVHFSSWMGGDRDGNPYVLSTTTKEVLLDSRTRAIKLFLTDIEELVKELSMAACTLQFREYIKDYEVQEPYRELMIRLRSDLRKTLQYLEQNVDTDPIEPNDGLILDNQQLWEPLYACYKSLIASNMEIIANDRLLDTMRRVKCFGLTLTQLDIRQESTVHTEALSEVTQYLGLGDYATWNEEEKQSFLLKELQSKRPLLPNNWDPSPQTKELLKTCKVIAETPQGCLPTYIISMTRTPSDILAVYLLLQEANCPYILPVTPLFETLNDLNNSRKIMSQLLDIDWYKKTIKGKQMVMIGYSDSAKDAGALAAGWAQYRGQESLIELCEQHDVKLTLFHGRGGTIGRGGGPAKLALFSQPPGSLKGGLRVTEQGEMIRFKLGNPNLAIKTLALYAEAVLEANLLLPPAPKKEWRNMMDKLADTSCRVYQEIVKEDADFIPYFYQATPESELGKLPLGSRPSKRRPDGGIESLRAIPWIFGWTQNRLMLPAWLGAGTAMQKEMDAGNIDLILEMYKNWPFFETRISMLEMVFAKTDLDISEYYDDRLVEEHLLKFGERLRGCLQKDIQTILSISGETHLMQDEPDRAANILMRNIYTNPLNLLQVELLDRCRKDGEHPKELELALMITISGIAAGMRNTG